MPKSGYIQTVTRERLETLDVRMAQVWRAMRGEMLTVSEVQERLGLSKFDHRDVGRLIRSLRRKGWVLQVGGQKHNKNDAPRFTACEEGETKRNQGERIDTASARLKVLQIDCKKARVSALASVMATQLKDIETKIQEILDELRS